jgi:hypothetical protein
MQIPQQSRTDRYVATYIYSSLHGVTSKKKGTFNE